MANVKFYCDSERCIECNGCGYCSYACSFGAPQFPESGAFSSKGKMDKCTFCAGGPEEIGSAEEYQKYGANRIAEGKLPLCAEMCATKALLAGDANVVSDIYRQRVINRSMSTLASNVGIQKDFLGSSPDLTGKATK